MIYSALTACLVLICLLCFFICFLAGFIFFDRKQQSKSRLIAELSDEEKEKLKRQRREYENFLKYDGSRQ